MVMTDWLRREAGMFEILIKVDAELQHDGTAVGSEGTGIARAFAKHINRLVDIAPLQTSQLHRDHVRSPERPAPRRNPLRPMPNRLLLGHRTRSNHRLLAMTDES